MLLRPLRSSSFVLVAAAAHRGKRQSAIRSAGQGNKRWIFIERCKHRIHPGFHHLFAAYGLIPLIFKEVALQQASALSFWPSCA